MLADTISTRPTDTYSFKASNARDGVFLMRVACL
jgi:hypothetical protein